MKLSFRNSYIHKSVGRLSDFIAKQTGNMSYEHGKTKTISTLQKVRTGGSG
jgi:hypothetical protein